MTLVYGHRGVRPVQSDARGALPIENTLAAVERALEEGADGVELDVRLCKTGEPIVLHDPDLMRFFGDARRAGDVSRGDLPHEIPALAEALDLCASRGALVNVELKYDVPDKRALARAVAKTIRASRARVLASSFDPRVLAAFAASAPRVPRAWIANATQRRIARFIAILARKPLFFAVHLERRLASPARIAMLKKRDLRVGVWTINDVREAKSCISLGVDWIITDCVSCIRDAR